MACQLNLKAADLPDNLHTIRGRIEHLVPHGRSGHRSVDKGAWQNTPKHVLDFWAANGIEAKIPDVLARHPKLMKGSPNTHAHLGTLGGGNHFIEICLDENDQVWVMLGQSRDWESYR